MIKILIADDEKPAREELEYLLCQVNMEIEIVGTAEDGAETLQLAAKYKPDLVFLDVHMPEMNGFEVAEKLKLLGPPPGIVFVTAYDKFAIRAFEINALDYILKPFVKERLVKSIERLTSARRTDSSGDFRSINRIIEKLDHLDACPKYISIPRGEHYLPVLIDNIVAVAAEGKDVRILSSEGVFLHSRTITSMEELLQDSKFFRCHRSYIINLRQISKIDIWFNNTYQLEMNGITEKIPVSRSYISKFRELMAID